MDAKPTLDDAARDLLFREARSANLFLDKVIDSALLHELYELAKWGPTSMNSCPARIVFLTTPSAKEKLLPALIDSNVKRAKSAPVIAIIGQDMEFFQYLPRLFPHNLANKEN